ncbi:Type III secretion system inner membrane R protein [mine drainage metagenome]|uniref:Type III secretion system inner membrane R protein n=1 Tax=mine drainage metagenome TaxID=410659 RepID=T0YFG7_9ZZZZ
MDLLTVTSTQWDAWIAQFFLPLARILSVLATAPVLGQSPAPVQVRIGLGLALTLVIAPALPPTHPSVSLVTLEGGMLLLEQIGIGLILGFCLNIVFAAVTMAGDMMGLQMGLGLPVSMIPPMQLFDPWLDSF